MNNPMQLTISGVGLLDFLFYFNEFVLLYCQITCTRHLKLIL